MELRSLGKERENGWVVRVSSVDRLRVTYALKVLTHSGRGPYSDHKGYPPAGEWSSPRVPNLCMSGWHVLPVDGDVSQAWALASHTYRNHKRVDGQLWLVKVRGRYTRDWFKLAAEYVQFVCELKPEVVFAQQRKMVYLRYNDWSAQKRDAYERETRTMHQLLGLRSRDELLTLGW